MSIQCKILDETTYRYAVSHSVKESSDLQKLREKTLALPEGSMMSAPEQGQLLSFLIKLIHAKNVIEIGTFTGYTSLWMAQALPDEGRVITCDIDSKAPKVGEPFWHQAKQAHKIKLHICDGLSLLDQLNEPFDLAYIDADKRNNINYFEKLLGLIRPDGLIIIDNVLWNGRVANDPKQDKRTQAIDEFNAAVANDERVEAFTLMIADGMTLARKI